MSLFHLIDVEHSTFALRQWPYSYDACDVGTLPNQTLNGKPEAATVNGDPYHGFVLSYLQGQRLSRCTCAGESHPGPMHSDGSFVGRSAPEIDIFEATVRMAASPLSFQSDLIHFKAQSDPDTGVYTGAVSQSCQFAVSLPICS
jgi:beta-glucan synthesis-associated protein KRE6